MALRLTTQATPDQISAAVNSAADRYHVPREVMWGMFDVETSLGQDIRTSSTGAVGPFQFEPGTAATYRYPLTNNPTPAQWQQQADAAAHYLADLKTGLGSWQNALAGYNAGPGNYKLPAAQSYAQKALAAGPKVIGQGYSTAAGGSITDAPASLYKSTGLPDPLAGIDAIGAFFNALGNPKTWLTILKVVGGAIAIYLGLRGLMGDGPSITKEALKVARA